MLIKWNGTYPPDTCEKCGETMAQDYESLIRIREHEVVFICDGCDTRRVGKGNGSYLPPEKAGVSYEELFPDVPYTPLTDEDAAELFKPGWQDMAGLVFIVVGLIAFGFLLSIAESMQ